MFTLTRKYSVREGGEKATRVKTFRKKKIPCSKIYFYTQFFGCSSSQTATNSNPSPVDFPSLSSFWKPTVSPAGVESCKPLSRVLWAFLKLKNPEFILRSEGRHKISPLLLANLIPSFLPSCIDAFILLHIYFYCKHSCGLTPEGEGSFLTSDPELNPFCF